MSRVISRTCLLLLSAMVGLGTAAGQQDDWLEGDVPQWLEDFAYEHAQDDGPVSEGTTQAHEGDSGSVARRAGQCLRHFLPGPNPPRSDRPAAVEERRQSDFGVIASDTKRCVIPMAHDFQPTCMGGCELGGKTP